LSCAGNTGNTTNADSKYAAESSVNQKEHASGQSSNVRYEIVKKETPKHPGETPLIYVVRTGNIDSVKSYLSGDIDINAQDSEGETALYWASLHGKTEIAQLLLQAGAQTNIKANDGTVPLHAAAMYSQDTLLIHDLLNHGADLEAVNEDNGWTPLVYAVAIPRPTQYAYFLEQGANPNVQDVDGATPLHFAVDKCLHPINQFQVVGMAITMPQEQFERRWRGYCITMVRNILAHGGNPETPDNKGMTPMNLVKKSDDIALLNIMTGNI